MNKIRLVFRGLSEIVGGSELGLLVLTDVASTRQLTIICDKQMEYQIGLRMGKASVTDLLLPEVLCQAMRRQGLRHFEILINDLKDGQYKVVLINNDTLDMIHIRASDAVLLSYISEIPIFIEERLMMRQSVPFSALANGLAIPVNVLNEEMLDEAMKKAIEDENYELASHLRDEKTRRSKVTDQEKKTE